MYEDPPRRGSLVPILTVVAALLALAVIITVVLIAMGFFGGGPTAVATNDASAELATAQADATTPPPAPPASPAGPAQVATTTEVPKAPVAPTPVVQAEPPVRSTHGDWQVRCDTPAGASQEQCVLMQFVTAEDRDNVGLTVIILKTADKQARIMRVLAPLGVLLPSGLGLKIDDTDMGRAGFVRCLPNGCVAEVILDDKLLDQLNTGKTATFIIFQTPEEGIGIPISLDGFQPGFAALP